jgi:hypothetical protein
MLDKIEYSRELEDIKYQPFRFSWGLITAFHKVGQYDIVEYHPWKAEHSRILIGQVDYEHKEFGCYIDGKPLGHSTTSLDSALALCIAYRVEGANHRADYYFIKALEMIKKDGE